MDDTLDRMKELWRQGYFCSQILMRMGLDLQGRDNLQLLRAMNGLAGGMGFTGELCGALSGGACLLGLYAGKGEDEDEEDLRLNFMIGELVTWFKNGYGQEYGGIRCDEILAGRSQNQAIRCPILVTGTLQKVKELLIENGFDLAGPDDD
ncbi:MAG: C-GCAxxG-C-C family protein [Anaerolineae bacterium]|nr:C-GCAxxG-C-C family protein [Anaerolineae bacterium]